MELSTYFAECYLPQRLIGRSSRTLEAYETALGRWRKFAEATPLGEIDAKLIARFQAALLETVGPASTNCYLRHIMAVLRCWAEECECRTPRWRKLREPKRVPLAFTVEEFSRVLAAAEDWPGEIGGVPAERWWRATLLVGWDTGLRFKALLALRPEDFQNGGLYCRAETQKDAEGQWFTLPPDTLLAVEAVHGTGRLLFPRSVTPETVGRWFRRILDHAGIFAPKGQGMRFHRLRRSRASYIKAAGGDATLALGHSSPSVTRAYYDPRIVGTAKPIFMPRPM